MDFAINVVVPAAQAFIMFSLGLGLTVADFSRVFSGGRAVVLGVVGQVILLPLVAFAMVKLFGLSPVFAAGTMLLAFCPGGVSSNVISKLSKGDLALSVSLTAVTSLLAFITVPPLATWAVLHFMGEAAPDFTIGEVALFTFLLTTVPVLMGVAIRHVFPNGAARIEGGLSNVAVGLWAVLILGIFYGSRDLILSLMPVLGPILLMLPFALLLLGLFVGRLFGLNIYQSKTLSVETSVQNSPLGIALAGVIMGTTTGMSELALPSALYSVTMYLIVIPAIFLFRRMGLQSTSNYAVEKNSL